MMLKRVRIWLLRWPSLQVECHFVLLKLQTCRANCYIIALDYTINFQANLISTPEGSWGPHVHVCYRKQTERKTRENSISFKFSRREESIAHTSGRKVRKQGFCLIDCNILTFYRRWTEQLLYKTKFDLSCTCILGNTFPPCSLL